MPLTGFGVHPPWLLMVADEAFIALYSATDRQIITLHSADMPLDILNSAAYFILHMIRHKKPDPKLALLEESGTANPHPDAVQDPAFQGSDFFDPRDLVQVRYEMLRRVRTEGHPIADAAARFGVSRPTFYKAQADFARDGLVGLLPVKRGPHGPHKVTDEVTQYVQELLGQEEAVDAASLVGRIYERFGIHVHRRTVERALARRKKKLP